MKLTKEKNPGSGTAHDPSSAWSLSRIKQQQLQRHYLHRHPVFFKIALFPGLVQNIPVTGELWRFQRKTAKKKTEHQ